MKEKLSIVVIIGRYFNTYGVSCEGCVLADFADRGLAEEYICKFDDPYHEVPFARIG